MNATKVIVVFSLMILLGICSAQKIVIGSANPKRTSEIEISLLILQIMNLCDKSALSFNDPLMELKRDDFVGSTLHDARTGLHLYLAKHLAYHLIWSV